MRCRSVGRSVGKLASGCQAHFATSGTHWHSFGQEAREADGECRVFVVVCSLWLGVVTGASDQLVFDRKRPSFSSKGLVAERSRTIERAAPAQWGQRSAVTSSTGPSIVCARGRYHMVQRREECSGTACTTSPVSHRIPRLRACVRGWLCHHGVRDLH